MNLEISTRGNGFSPLDYAIFCGYYGEPAKGRPGPVLEFLLAEGADCQHIDPYGLTPLHRAILQRNVEAAEILLDHGADANFVDHYGFSALHYALFAADADLVQLLLKRGSRLSFARRRRRVGTDQEYPPWRQPSRFMGYRRSAWDKLIPDLENKRLRLLILGYIAEVPEAETWTRDARIWLVPCDLNGHYFWMPFQIDAARFLLKLNRLGSEIQRARWLDDSVALMKYEGFFHLLEMVNRPKHARVGVDLWFSGSGRCRGPFAEECLIRERIRKPEFTVDDVEMGYETA
jgi:hypothetical protein